MSKGRQLTKGQRFELVEKNVKQLQMTTKVNQMMLQQIGNSVSPMQNDLGELAARQRELQYRVLACQELLSLKLDDIEAKSLELQAKDFQESSDKEDADKSYIVADVVAENSAVIITSKTPEEEEDKGIFRSKIVLSDIAIPELSESLLGKKVGDKVESDVNGVKHVIEVLGIRSVPEPEPEKEEATVASKPAQESTDGQNQQA